MASDGLVVIIKKNSLPQLCITALGGLTFAQLCWMFSSYTAIELTDTGWSASALANSDGNDNTHLFSELSASCPNIEIKLVGPTSAFDANSQFRETILTDFAYGETFDLLRPAGAAYSGTTTDTATINTVQTDTTGASVGFVYFNAFNPTGALVKAISTKKSTGFINPTMSTIRAGAYPLSN